MAQKRVRVGVIGLGLNGRCFVEAYHRNPKVELVAIADLCEEKRTEIGERFGIPKEFRYPSFEMFERDDIDMISIHTPDHLHAEPFIRAVEVKKHVFVEKPMADSLSDLGRMLDAWRGTGLKTMVGHILRFNPYFRMLKGRLFVTNYVLRDSARGRYRCQMFMDRGILTILKWSIFWIVFFGTRNHWWMPSRGQIVPLRLLWVIRLPRKIKPLRFLGLNEGVLFRGEKK